MSIYLACHAMDPDGPDVFAQPLGDLRRPEDEASAHGWRSRFAAARAERAPRDAAAGRAALRAIVAAAVARLEALREVRAAAEAADRADDLGPAVATTPRSSVDWLRKHQATCSRSLYRTFDELRKLRRDFGDGSRRRTRSPRIAGLHEIDPFRLPPSEFRLPPEVVAPEALAPTDPEPAAVEPAGDGDVADATNEANRPVAATDSGRRTTDDGERMTDHGPGDATNEASSPAAATDNGQESKTNEATATTGAATRPVAVTALAVLVLLFVAGSIAAFAASVKAGGRDSSQPSLRRGQPRPVCATAVPPGGSDHRPLLPGGEKVPEGRISARITKKVSILYYSDINDQCAASSSREWKSLTRRRGGITNRIVPFRSRARSPWRPAADGGVDVEGGRVPSPARFTGPSRE